MIRSDVVEALELLQRTEFGGSLRSLDKESEVEHAEEESEDEAEVEEMGQEVSAPALHETEVQETEDDEEYYFTLDDISVCPFPRPGYNAYETEPVDLRTIHNVGSSSVRGGGNGPLSVLKRYLSAIDIGTIHPSFLNIRLFFF